MRREGSPVSAPPGEEEEKRREEPPVREGRSPGNVGSERGGLEVKCREGASKREPFSPRTRFLSPSGSVESEGRVDVACPSHPLQGTSSLL